MLGTNTITFLDDIAFAKNVFVRKIDKETKCYKI
jgi:hypothetical protein